MTKNFVVVAYYTPGTLYEEHAKNLIASMKEFDLAYKVSPVDDKGNWYKNTQYKATFLRNMLDEFPGVPLVYVDVDAVFCKSPDLFSKLAKDPSVLIGAHVLDHNQYRRKGVAPELLSGTVYLSNNKEVRKLVDTWIVNCAASPEIWDQAALKQVVDKMDYGFFNLPAQYCKIFDYMESVEGAVITHFQASRAMRRMGFNNFKRKVNQPRVVRKNGVVRIRRVHRA